MSTDVANSNRQKFAIYSLSNIESKNACYDCRATSCFFLKSKKTQRNLLGTGPRSKWILGKKCQIVTIDPPARRVKHADNCRHFIRSLGASDDHRKSSAHKFNNWDFSRFALIIG